MAGAGTRRSGGGSRGFAGQGGLGTGVLRARHNERNDRGRVREVFDRASARLYDLGESSSSVAFVAHVLARDS
jgi:hypothetical protein